MSDDFFNMLDQKSSQSETKVNAPIELSVSEISQNLKTMVEKNFGYVRIRGELSRVTVAKSGHIYTSLKDDKSVLDAICWRGTAGKLSISPEEGLDVIVTGRITTYPGRSNYQMIIETMELAGAGALLKMLEERRKKLASEGLFDPDRKKKIPFLPDHIGVVTSPTGAVIRDIMHRLNDRFPRAVTLWPAVVQGEKAAMQIIAGITGFNALPQNHPNRPDVIIVARGGGSLEDLMPFNDEAVVRAIAASDIPIISAVGHETDTTLADYAADLRAPTPTGAAEKAVPVRADLITHFEQIKHRANQGVKRRFREFKLNLKGLNRGLIHPKNILDRMAQSLDYASTQMDQSFKNTLQRAKTQLVHSCSRLSRTALQKTIIQNRETLARHHSQSQAAIKRRLEQERQRLSSQTHLLESLSFKRTLDRGYAIIKTQDGHVIQNVKTLDAQHHITVELKDGERQVKIN